MSLLPVFLKLEGRACLVVGAGEVAAGKIESLVASGARVTVVAPWARPEILRLHERNAILWHPRPFEDTDLDGQFVVVAGTDSAAVNQHVYRLCDARAILCNAVDDPPHCDFYYGSVVSRGDLQIAISTAGESPAVAQRLRREVDAQLPHDLGPWLHALGSLRRDVLAEYPAGDERKLLLHQLAERPVCQSANCPTRAVAFPQLPHAPQPPQQRNWSTSPASVTGKVFLVGAGPGDPDLLTIRAARLLAQADLVLHDDLVPDPVLALIAPSAEVIAVGKRCGRASITQAGIHTLMIAGARAGRAVVRLKSGDPLLFGRAGEEMDALRGAEIAFEVVAGVTAASAAAAAIPCSLTDRRMASSVLLSTAHHAPGDSPPAEPTRVVYMPGRDLTSIARAWRSEGLPADYPCLLVSRAGRPDQQVARTTLDLLHVTSPGAAPSLLLGGAVFAERQANAPAEAAEMQAPDALRREAYTNATE